MDLYFHNPPKKRRAFSIPFIKKKSTTIHPEQRLTPKRKFSASSVTDFFHKKVSALPIKKFKSQIFPSKRRDSDCSSVIDDGVKNLEVLTHPLSLMSPPPPPLKLETIPGLPLDTEYFLDRALPSLPQADPVKVIDERKETERRTANLRKWLKAHKEEKNTNEKERLHRITTPRRIISSMFSKKMTLHCKGK